MTATRLDKTLDNSEITGQKQGLETLPSRTAFGRAIPGGQKDQGCVTL